MADSYEIGQGHITVETRYDGRTVRRVSARAGQQAGRSFQNAFFGYGRMGQNRRFRLMLDQFFKPIRRMQSILNKTRRPALFAGIAASVLTLIPTVTQLTSAVGAGAVPATLAWYSSIFLVRGLLGALNKSIKNQTLKLMNDLSGELKEVARNAAAPGLNAFIEEALTHAPILVRYVKALGIYAGHVAFSFRDLLNREANIRRIRTTLDGTARATGMWYSLLDEAAEVILVIAAAGTPLFERFTRSMLRVGHTIHDWVMLQEATGALQRHLNRSYETLEKFGRGGRDFLIGLFNIINGGVFGTEKVADSFEEWGAAFREWTTHAENIEKIRKVIQFMTENVGNFFRFAAAALLVGKALGSISAIEGLIMSLRTMLTLGPVAFVLFGIGAAVASLAGGFVLAYSHSEKFRKKVHDLWAEIKERMGPIFGDWVKWIRDDLLPAMEEFAIKGVERLSGFLRDLMTVIEENAEGLRELRPVIVFLMGVFGRLAVEVLGAFIDEVKGVITVLGWLGRIVGWVGDFFGKLPGWIGGAIDKVMGWFNRLKERAGEVVHNTAAEFRALPGKITGWLKTLPGAFVKSLNAAFDGAIVAVGFGIGSIVEFFVRLPGRIVAGLNAGWDLLYAAVKKAIGETVNFFALLPGRVMRWFDRTWDSAYETTARWFEDITDFVEKLPGRVIRALFDLGPKIKKRFSESWGGAQKESGNRIAAFMTWAGKIPGRVWQALVRLKNRLVDRFATGWAAATGTSKTKVVGIINFILGIPGRAWNALRALAGRLKERASTGWQAFRDELGRRVGTTIVYVSQIPGRINRGLGNMASLLRQKGRDVISGLIEGMKARWEDLKKWILGIPDWIRKHKGPLDFDRRLLIPAGKAIMEGLGTGLFFGSKGPFSFISGMAKSIKDLLSMDVMSIFGGIFGDEGRRGGGGSFAGLVGFAKMAMAFFQNAFPGMMIGGWRARGSVPGSDHPKGKALDLMTTNPAIHRAIIEMGKKLPGAKYWISMRRIAFANEGWKSRPYSGPSPHTDHVHWSFYRQGTKRGLPEDVYGMGKSGRGYVMHRGEQVIRRNETRVGHQGNVYNFAPGSIVVDPRNIKEFNDVIRVIQGAKPAARARPRPAGVY